ncbi:unnamed protein product [marine sediment metagenome]|uniref:Thymidylate kinase-like domain-containing protein n=1 Tax=marine sediment metagenome TaxID=412755 RepID=X1LWW7_9ZZZZ
MKQFITFEGIDGSGKSTVSKVVYDKLKSDGHNVVLTYEPTDSTIGKFVQEEDRAVLSESSHYTPGYQHHEALLHRI